MAKLAFLSNVAYEELGGVPHHKKLKVFPYPFAGIQ